MEYEIETLIFYEDSDIFVIRKPAGLAVETKKSFEQDLVSLLKNYRAAKNEDSYIGVIHRLDQPVNGLLVFAKNQKAAATLSKELQKGNFNKIYNAVVEGKLEGEETLTDYIFKDAKNNCAKILDKSSPLIKAAKKAVLSYTALSYDEEEDFSTLYVKLETGRFHQIRAQLSNLGHPILGDKKYGSKKPFPKQGIGLTAISLSFTHPITGELMEFEIE